MLNRTQSSPISPPSDQPDKTYPDIPLEKYRETNNIAVSPAGGYGAYLPPIIEFEKKYRFEDFESAIIVKNSTELNKDDWRIIQIIQGNETGVPSSPYVELSYQTYNDLISCHNHPYNRNSAVEYHWVYPSFSVGDIETFIEKKLLEIRVINDDGHTFVMQKPVIGWDEWYKKYKLKVNPFSPSGMRRLEFSYYPLLSDDDSTEKMVTILDLIDEYRFEVTPYVEKIFPALNVSKYHPKGDEQAFANETRHYEWNRFSQEYGFPYGRFGERFKKNMGLIEKGWKQSGPFKSMFFKPPKPEPIETMEQLKKKSLILPDPKKLK